MQEATGLEHKAKGQELLRVKDYAVSAAAKPRPGSSVTAFSYYQLATATLIPTIRSTRGLSIALPQSDLIMTS